MKLLLLCLAACGCIVDFVHSFQVLPTIHGRQVWMSPTSLRSGQEDDGETAAKKEKVVSLVADDEWTGLGMELSELVRTAVLEDLKQKSREFLGKDEYKRK